MSKYLKKSGFTMAEAVLVMTILGIIATIMITTMKPAKFKEQGYEVLAKQTLADIDTTLNMILTNHCPYGTFDVCYKLDSTETFDMSVYIAGANNPCYSLGKLMKHYMSTSREQAKDWDGNYQNSSTTATTNKDDIFMLKNGVVLDINRNSSGNVNTWIPGEESKTVVPSTNLNYGYIKIDINGEAEPNVLGKDRYLIPLDRYGVAGGE